VSAYARSLVEPAGRGDEPTSQMLRRTAGVMLGLLFLVGPLSDLFDSSLSAARLAVIAVCFVLFVALYGFSMRTGRLRSLPPEATLALLAGLVLLPTAMLAAGAPSSFELLFIFFVAAAGMRLKPKPALVLIALTAAGVGIAGAAMHESSSATSAKVLSILAIGAMMTAFNRQIRINRELEAARHELARLAVADERLRIARDLHDLLGHSLSVITLKSELAAKLVTDDPQRAAAELADVQDVGRQALAEVREAVQGYRQLALGDALTGARAVLSAAGIECEIENGAHDLPREVEELFAWAVREGTTNIVRHSSAEHCAVRILDEPGQLAVEVEDDGPAAPAAPQAGNGLTGLAERAARLRGRLEVVGEPGRGFRLRLVVPVQS
jgi:two-component system, NarL family, sensor histidine kinase DesK